MKRRCLPILLTWKERASRVPLLLRGARQVGKTWLVRELARSFDSFVEINLEADTEAHPAFRDYFGKPEKLIPILSLLTGKKIEPGKTLLFLDEIQSVKEALLSLRYFKEELPALHVIAAGSLLEFAIRDLSFPVGRIDFLHLFPLNFEEYLLAQNREDILEVIQNASFQNPIPEAIHQQLLKEATTYSLLGGMPEGVKTYIETKSFQEVQTIQQRIIANYREDFYKYKPRANTEHIRKIFDGAPRLLGQKFQYAQIDRETKSRELQIALNLLVDAGLLYKIHHTSARGLPLASQIKENQFKVYPIDIGLAQRILGLNLSREILDTPRLLTENRGGITEQFVAQELLSTTPMNDFPQLFYWHREAKSSSAEVDFVVQKENKIIPIEVKSGNSGKTRSLHLFMEERKNLVEKGIKISPQNFAKQNKIEVIPLYATLKAALS